MKKILLTFLISLSAFAGYNPKPILLTASVESVAKGSGQTFTLTATYTTDPGEEETILFTVPSDTDTKTLTTGGSTTSKTFDITSETAGWKTCQASFQNATMITKVAVVEVDKIQFMNNRITDNNWTDWSSVIYPQLDQTVEFKAFPFPSDAPWPSSYPVWGGSANGSGSDEISVDFSVIENTTVKAYCDASYGVTENVTVIQDNGDATLAVTSAGEYKATYHLTCWMLDGGSGEFAISMPVSDYDSTLEVKQTVSFSSGALVNESYIYRTGIDTSSDYSDVESGPASTETTVLLDNGNAFPTLEYELKGGLFDCKPEGGFALAVADPVTATTVIIAVSIAALSAVAIKIIDEAVEDVSNNVGTTWSPLIGNGIVVNTACSFTSTTTAGCDNSWAISTWLNKPWNQVWVVALPAFVVGADLVQRQASPAISIWCNYAPLKRTVWTYNQPNSTLRLFTNNSPNKVNNFPGATTAAVIYAIAQNNKTTEGMFFSLGTGGVTQYFGGASPYVINAQRGADYTRINWP